MKRNHVSTRGIAYEDGGSGPVVILIHAFGFDGDMWGLQTESLRAAGYRVLVPDLRGFGASPGPAPGFEFDHIVDDIIGLLDDADASQVVAAGVSMGAATSVALAVAHPARVAGLLLADNSLPDGRARGQSAADRIRSLGMSGLADVYEPILFGESYRREHPEDVSAWRERLVVRDPEHLATIVEAYHSRNDLSASLSRISVPTAIVFGEEDAAVPEHRRNDYGAIPGAKHSRIDGAGHMSNVERPDDFNSILLEIAKQATRAIGSV